MATMIPGARRRRLPTVISMAVAAGHADLSSQARCPADEYTCGENGETCPHHDSVEYAETGARHRLQEDHMTTLTVGHGPGKHDDAENGDRTSCAWCPSGVGTGLPALAPLDPPRVSGNGDQGRSVARPYVWGGSTAWAQASLRKAGLPL